MVHGYGGEDTDGMMARCRATCASLEKPSGSDVALLLERNELDVELYDYAVRLFEERLSEARQRRGELAS